ELGEPGGGTIFAPPLTLATKAMRAVALPLALVWKPPGYSPGATCTVLPGTAASAARAMLRKGASGVPELLSEPAGDTYHCGPAELGRSRAPQQASRAAQQSRLAYRFMGGSLWAD